MRVWMDGSAFEGTNQSGIWRVCYETLERLPSAVEKTLWLRAAPVRPIPAGVNICRDKGRERWWKSGLGGVYRKLTGTYPDPRSIKNCDVYHCTNFFMPRTSLPYVLTIYDMIAELFLYEVGDWGRHMSEVKRDLIQNASRIICISHSAASDLVAFYPEVESKVRVAHLGFSHLQSTQKIDKAAKNFVLYVGNRQNYKNFRLILMAAASKSWPADIQIRVAGPEFSVHERNLCKYYGIEHRIVSTGFLSDAELANEYANALGYVFPSLIEGFGIPVLEAQANRCPALLSDIPIFHEVACKSAHYFDCRNPESLISAIIALTNDAYRESLVQSGIENIRRFTWDQFADVSYQCYVETS